MGLCAFKKGQQLEGCKQQVTNVGPFLFAGGFRCGLFALWDPNVLTKTHKIQVLSVLDVQMSMNYGLER